MPATKKTAASAAVSVTLVLLLAIPALAHEEEEAAVQAFAPEQLAALSVPFVLGVAVLSVALVLFAIVAKPQSNVVKGLLFAGIAIPVVLATLFLAGSTIYLNLVSETNGPVHWHADFEVWHCREKIDLLNPSGLSNRIGTPVLHEHGDDRIHVEGVLVQKSDADLHSFFAVVGGSLSRDELAIPTDEGVRRLRNGDFCGSREGVLQVFVYRVVNAYPGQHTGFLYEQVRLEDFEDYALSPFSSVPPGDCVIIEFGEEKAATEHICETYAVAIGNGDMKEAGQDGS